jgi:hypothetical protein
MRRLITTVVVLVALFVLVDRVSVSYAEHRVATTLRDTEHLESTPSVTIHGFPFLTQLARGHFGDVEVVVNNFRRGAAIDVDRIDVHLRGATVSLSDALAGGATRVPVDRVDGTVTVSYASLSQVHPGLTFAYAGGGRVRVTGAVTVLGHRIQASGTGRMVLVSHGLSVVIDDVTGAGSAATAAINAAARRALGVSTALSTLPFHFTLSSVRATSAGIEISGTARDVTLSASAA